MASNIQLAKDLIIQSLRIYRRIWKCHNICLDGELRLFGNQYVKEEFKVHLKKATPDQFKVFIQSWERYATFMEKSGLKKAAKQRAVVEPNVPDALGNKLTDVQKKVLNSFKEAIYAIKRQRNDQKK